MIFGFVCSVNVSKRGNVGNVKTTVNKSVIMILELFAVVVLFVCFLFSGANGTGLNISHFKLSPEDRRKEKSGQNQHRFNAYLSDVISFHRQLPDVRHEELVVF